MRTRPAPSRRPGSLNLALTRDARHDRPRRLKLGAVERRRQAQGWAAVGVNTRGAARAEGADDRPAVRVAANRTRRALGRRIRPDAATAAQYRSDWTSRNDQGFPWLAKRSTQPLCERRGARDDSGREASACNGGLQAARAFVPLRSDRHDNCPHSLASVHHVSGELLGSFPSLIVRSRKSGFNTAPSPSGPSARGSARLHPARNGR